MKECNPENEDLRKYAGEVIPDPWEDPSQKDWPMNEGGNENGMGPDNRPEDLARS